MGFDLGGTVAVIIANAVLTANRTAKFKYLRFVEFGTAIATKKKEALGFLRHFLATS